MTTPVTEIGSFTFIANANIAKPLDDIKIFALHQAGIVQPVMCGAFEFLLTDFANEHLRKDWTNIRFHKQYEQTPINYPPVVAILTLILAAAPFVFHAELGQDALCAVMDVPIIEVTTFVPVSADFADIAKPVLKAFRGSAGGGFMRLVDGPVTEAIAQEPEVGGEPVLRTLWLWVGTYWMRGLGFGRAREELGDHDSKF
ncbi:hypothetical protein BJX65DRAFT_309341 [Aspergillus insuetus]